MIQYWQLYLVATLCFNSLLKALCQVRVDNLHGCVSVFLPYLMTSMGKIKVSVAFTWVSLAVEQARKSLQCFARPSLTCQVMVRVNWPVNRALTDSTAWGRVNVRGGVLDVLATREVGPGRPGHQDGLSLECLILHLCSLSAVQWSLTGARFLF